jgi:hypothetical protein
MLTTAFALLNIISFNKFKDVFPKFFHDMGIGVSRRKDFLTATAI